MKFTKKTNDTSTICKVWNDDKSKCYGVVGTVGDLLQADILSWCDYSPTPYAFIGVNGQTNRFGKDKEEACAEIKE